MEQDDLPARPFESETLMSQQRLEQTAATSQQFAATRTSETHLAIEAQGYKEPSIQKGLRHKQTQHKLPTSQLSHDFVATLPVSTTLAKHT